MKFYDEQLSQLREQCTRKKKLKAAVAQLQTQQADYLARTKALKQAMQKEQADVDRLEEKGLSGFFYNVIGKMDEKLAREKQEAYAARTKYDSAKRELDGIDRDLKAFQLELDAIGDCEDRYVSIMQQKIQAVKAAGGTAAEEILYLEDRAAYLTGQSKELAEALEAGRSALATSDQIAEDLRSAEHWGTWDLVGGGMLFDFAKHDKLDRAQDAVEHLQSQLRRFRTELSDVTIDADFQVNIDGFLRVADYVFDGIFADWAVLNRIRQSQDRIEEVRGQIRGVLGRLENLMHQTGAEREELIQKIQRLAEEVPM